MTCSRRSCSSPPSVTSDCRRARRVPFPHEAAHAADRRVRVGPVHGHPGGGRELQNQLQVWKPSLILEHDALALGGYIGELRNLAQCALGEAEPIATLDDSTAALQLAEATWTSAQSGAEVPIPNHRG